MRDLFMLAADETYLNAGTFSALPRAVYDELIRLIATAEANPTRQAAMRKREPLWRVQQLVAEYLGAAAQDIVFHVNVTEALNTALLGWPWPAGGELLIHSREYPSIVRSAEIAAKRRGLTIRRFDLPRQPQSNDEVVEAMTAALSANTAGVLLSHVVCTTGQVLPVEAMAAALCGSNVRLVVDGAHAPGLIPLRLGDSSIDFYGGNLHKWFMGPKGTGFLYVRRELQQRLNPSVVGFDGDMDTTEPLHEPIAAIPDRFQCVFRLHGLRDVSPFLALEATLAFRRQVGEQAIIERVGQLCDYARKRIGLRALSPSASFQAGLVTFEPPPDWRVADATERMYAEHRISVPIWRGASVGWMMRVSPHIWNCEGDIDRLARALGL